MDTSFSGHCVSGHKRRIPTHIHSHGNYAIIKIEAEVLEAGPSQTSTKTTYMYVYVHIGRQPAIVYELYNIYTYIKRQSERHKINNNVEM